MTQRPMTYAMTIIQSIHWTDDIGHDYAHEHKHTSHKWWIVQGYIEWVYEFEKEQSGEMKHNIGELKGG